jgi:flagellar basal body-associated protein FliL
MSAPVQKSGPKKRSRIVVDFDKAREMAHVPQRSGSGGGRGGKIIGIIAIVLALIVLGAVVGGFLWWRSYKTRPAYSLALLVDAAQRNDAKAMDEIIDTDKIVANLIPQVTEKALGRYAAALTGPLSKQVESLVPKLLPDIKDKVRDEVSNQVKEMGKRAEGKPFILIALGVPYVVGISEEGETAKVTANLEDRQTELTMQRNGERWKIVGVKDDALAARMVDNIAKNLPAVGSELEKLLPKPGEDKSGRRRTGRGR